MSNLLTETHDKIAEGVSAVEGWINDLKGHLPEVASLAAKFEQSPIVQALQNAVLPPNVEAEIAKLIGEASAAFAEHGGVTVEATATPAPAETPAPAAEPTPASPADPTTPAA